MSSALNRKPDGTIELTITIPSTDIAKTKEELIANQVKAVSVPGFRKGKAPKKLVEEQINTEKLQEEILKKLLPAYYIEAVKKHDLKPIINPKIHVTTVEEDKDWEFTAITAEAPQLVLGDYKKKVQAVTAKSKIIIPGKETQPPKFEDIMDAVLAAVTVTIPKVLIDQEVDRLLSQMLDEVKTLGLTLDQYLSSTKKDPQILREEYAKKAEFDIKIEFVLQKIAEAEKITVEQKEIDEAIQKAKDDAERKNLEANRYLLAAIIRQQKTLDFLKNL
ncbi:MAG: hypothetical protein HYT10_02870 [Candidatus Levybacteria bacterium]|nr:hypothetical protein [Candidatus Levybacteria bacterium]